MTDEEETTVRAVPDDQATVDAGGKGDDPNAAKSQITAEKAKAAEDDIRSYQA